MSEEIRKHPLNAVGKYYVDQDNCTCMEAYADVAPNIFVIDSVNYSSYVIKQPETQEEVDQCNEAIICCAFEAIHDDGNE
jgi:ferredoxin